MMRMRKEETGLVGWTLCWRAWEMLLAWGISGDFHIFATKMGAVGKSVFFKRETYHILVFDQNWNNLI